MPTCILWTPTGTQYSMDSKEDAKYICHVHAFRYRHLQVKHVCLSACGLKSHKLQGGGITEKRESREVQHEQHEKNSHSSDLDGGICMFNATYQVHSALSPSIVRPKSGECFDDVMWMPRGCMHLHLAAVVSVLKSP